MSQYSNKLNQQTNFALPPSGKLILPFAIESAVTSLPVFCASEGQASILANLVEFLSDGGYQWAVRACPSTNQEGGSNTILANQMYEDQISVPAGSFLTMIGGISTVAVPGFRIQVFDAGGQDYISDNFVHAQSISGRFFQLPQTGSGQDTTVSGSENLFILPSPLSISSPGQLNVQIVNLASETATIEMAFVFAVPVQDYYPISAAWLGNSVGR